MAKLGAMKPKFLRFPGGSYLTGITIDTRFDWKKTIGPIEQRPGHQGLWGYRSYDGEGLLEFLEWCEDLHMQPLLGVYVGYSAANHISPGPDLVPYVQTRWMKSSMSPAAPTRPGVPGAPRTAIPPPSR